MLKHSLRRSLPVLLSVVAVVFACEKCLSWGGKSADTKLFEKHCQVCHTIRGGAKIGPDLKKAGSKPEKALRADIERMAIKSGPLKADEVERLVRFLKEQSGAGGAAITAASEPIGRPAPESWPGKWDLDGAKLYSGRKAFKNGGRACIACHDIKRRGLISPLGRIAHKQNKDKLLDFLHNTHIWAMRKAYSKHPVTREEATALASYFGTVTGQAHKNGK